MEIQKRQRWTEVNGTRLAHYDLVLLAETEDESKLLDLLGAPDSYVQGQVRLADGYGEHYLLIQPRKMLYDNGDFREFPEPDELTREHQVTTVANPKRKSA